MLRKISALVISVLIAGFIYGRYGYGSGGNGGYFYNMAPYINSLPYQEISEAEKQALLHMREEEKLARDVYRTLYERWGLRVFSNIAASEQRHMDAVKILLLKYNIEDPVKDDSVGVFSNPEMTKLYEELVAKGLQSPADALMVGATIEDLDIYDLQKWLLKVDNTDIVFVFSNLKKGSENHIRAFTRILKNQYGITYKAQYITQEELDLILSSGSNGPGYGRRRRGGRW